MMTASASSPLVQQSKPELAATADGLLRGLDFGMREARLAPPCAQGGVSTVTLPFGG